MKDIRTIVRFVGIWGFIFLLAGCSGDQISESVVTPEPEPVEEPEQTQATPLYLRGFVAPYNEVAEATRASTFSFPGYITATEYMPIGAFFTPSDNPRRTILHAFDSSTHDDIWTYTPPTPIDDGDYQLYGYMPNNAAEVTIAPTSPSTTYTGGVTMTFTGMNIVTSKDVCVMVGAKHGTDKDTPVKDGEDNLLLKTGDFDIHMNNNGSPNYLFLLFDHLYAAISFSFRLDVDYAKVRSIHLKKLQLTAYSDVAYTIKRYKEQNATVVLEKKTDGSSPIKSILFEDDPASGLIDKEKFFEGEIVLSPDIWAEEIAYVPYTQSYYILHSTYDVYDKMGNLIRQDQVAENKFNPKTIFSSDMQRGKKYVLKLIITPTYLYQLSDQDLDNPTITISN